MAPAENKIPDIFVFEPKQRLINFIFLLVKLLIVLLNMSQVAKVSNSQ